MSFLAGPSTRGALGVAVAALSWGSVGLVAQRIQRTSGLEAHHIAFLRSAIAAACLAPFTMRSLGPGPHRSQSVATIAAGVFLGLNQLFYFMAVDRVGVSTAALITLGLSPVLASLGETVLERSLPSRRVLVALACSLVGLVLLSGVASIAITNSSGIALSILSACCFALVALVALVQRYIPAGSDHTRTTAMVTGTTALSLLPLVAVNDLSWTPTPLSIAGLGYLGVGATAVAYVCYFRGLATVRASRALLLVLIEPLTASLLGIVVEGEQLTADQELGAALLLFGVAGATRAAPAGEAPGITASYSS